MLYELEDPSRLLLRLACRIDAHTAQSTEVVGTSI